MLDLIRELQPINRSITGDGLRESLRRIGLRIPLKMTEVPSGTRVFDWTVPREWNLRDAWIKDSTGRKIITLPDSNLHVVGYSVPVQATMSLAELKPHLFSMPTMPEAIPYRTSYYSETWGFCLRDSLLRSLSDGPYEVRIDSTLADGALTYAECFIKGSVPDEVLISTHCCHPAMCNDNLSGMAVATALAQRLQSQSLRYSYRFLFIPGTIGAITWLAKNESRTSNIVAGLTLALLGDGGRITYKKSRRGNAEIDRAAMAALRDAADDQQIRDFSPYGYDERQYCSPGFNLPVGCLTRTPFGEFPEYHSSADNLDFIQEKALADSLEKLQTIVTILEGNRKYRNLNPKCEPQLGKRGLYGNVGGTTDPKTAQLAMLWVLNLSDGIHDLLSIVEKSGLDFITIRQAATALAEKKLLREEMAESSRLTDGG